MIEQSEVSVLKAWKDTEVDRRLTATTISFGTRWRSRWIQGGDQGGPPKIGNLLFKRFSRTMKV